MSSLHKYKIRNTEWIDRLLGLALAGILLMIFVAIILVPSLLHVAGPQTVPYPLHSVLQADYSQDPLNLQHARVELAVIAQVIQDHRPTGIEGNPALLEMGLETPVPTVTLFPGLFTPIGSIPPEGDFTPAVTHVPPIETRSTSGANSTPILQATPTTEGTNHPSLTLITTENATTATQSASTQPPSGQAPTPTRHVRTPTPGITQTSPSATSQPALTLSPPPTSVLPSATSNPPTQPFEPSPTPRPNTATPEPTEPPPPTRPPRPTNTPDSYPPPPPSPSPYP